MKKYKIWLFLVLIAIMPVFISAVTANKIAYSQDTVGIISSVAGPLDFNSGGSGEYSVLHQVDALNMPLNNNDVIRSRGDSTAEVKMNNGAVMQLAAGVEMQFGYNNIRINRGGAWINYKSKTDDGKISFVVATPAGTMGIKGTTFAVKVDDANNNAFLQVKEGIVEFKQDKTNKTVDVTGNQLLVIEKGKEIGAPVTVSGDYDLLVPAGAGGPGSKNFEDYQNSNPFDQLRKK
jgi:hypothetical protein